ncbi:MAG: hypothetical protein WBE73_04885 [Candidatus Acidiferrum sp.]
MALLILVVLLVATSASLLRLRGLPSMRPWLVRHLMGNSLLAIGLIAAWYYDLAIVAYVAIAAGVFALWMWGTWKLREAIQKNK